MFARYGYLSASNSVSEDAHWQKINKDLSNEKTPARLVLNKVERLCAVGRSYTLPNAMVNFLLSIKQLKDLNAIVLADVLVHLAFTNSLEGDVVNTDTVDAVETLAGSLSEPRAEISERDKIRLRLDFIRYTMLIRQEWAKYNRRAKSQ